MENTQKETHPGVSRNTSLKNILDSMKKTNVFQNIGTPEGDVT